MTQFHEGQEVEVRGVYRDPYWRSGKIVSHEAYLHGAHEPDRYFIEFPDGTRAVSHVDHIRLPQSEWDILRASCSHDSYASDHECADGTNE